MSDMKFVSTNARIPFRCQRCAQCCRHLKDSLMLEPRDIFYLARFLQQSEKGINCTEDMLERYAHLVSIEFGFPIYQVNTTGEDDACVFLTEGACRVYGARPQVCRMYPFGTAPGSRGKDFNFYLCIENEHHFGTGQVKVKDWISDNFSREAREFDRLESELLPAIGNAIPEKSRDRGFIYRLMYELYAHYDLSQPFMEQYRRNAENIREML